MNSLRYLAVLLLATTLVGHAAPPMANLSQPQPAIAKDAINYTVRVEWKNEKKETNSIQIVTSEGHFELDTLSGTTKIDDSDIPSTVKFDGTLTELSSEKGRLTLFLGRTVPYVTGTSGAGVRKSSSYSQLSIGLNSTFVVIFGKPLIIQTDDKGTVSVLVKRDEN
jgi:hypothetical protein